MMRYISLLVGLVVGAVGFGQTTLAEYRFENNLNPEAGAIGSPNLTFSISPNFNQGATGQSLATGTGGATVGAFIEISISTSSYENISISWEGRTSNNDTPGSWDLTVNDGSGFSSTVFSQNLTNNFSNTGAININQLDNNPNAVIRITANKISARNIRIDDLIITGDIITTPFISTSLGTIFNHDYIFNNGPSLSQSYTVIGEDLVGSGDITLTAPTNFEISTDNNNFFSTLELPYAGGQITGQPVTIYARLESGLAVGNYSGNITHTGGGAPTVEVSVSGNVTPPLVLPYFNELRSDADSAQTIADGFAIVNAINETGGDGYLRIFNNGYVETTLIDFTAYDLLEVEVDLTTFGGATGQTLSFEISNDGGNSYSTVESILLATSGTDYNTYNVFFDATGANNVTNGKLRFRMSSGTNSTRFRDFTLREYSGKYWSGLTDDDWNDPGNWSPTGVPSTGDEIIIQSSAPNSPVVSGALTLNSNGKLELKSNAQLTVTGAITNDGEIIIENGATLVQTGTASNSGSGTYSVIQFLEGSGGTTPDGRGYYIGSPLSNATSATFDTADNNLMWVYSEEDNGYTAISNNTTAMDAMEGYVVRLGSNGFYTFTGSGINTGTISNTDLTRTGTTNAKRGYHLVSNPYLSYLDWDDVDADDLSTTMWYRTEGSGGMVFDTYNSSGSVGVSNSGDPVTGYIPPMQSFWVYVPDDGLTGSLTFDNSMRSHQPSAFGLKSGDDHTAFVRLNLWNDTLFDQSVVYYNEGAMTGHDAFDSPKQSIASRAEIYTIVDNNELVINGLHSIDEQDIVPLVLRLPNAGEFSIEGVEVFVENGKVWLEDIEEGVSIELADSTSYTFESNQGVIDDRFQLLFTVEENTANTVDLSSSEVNIAANHIGNVRIQFPTQGNEQSSVSVTDLSGRMIYTNSTNDLEYEFTLSAPNGIYIVNVMHKNRRYTEKIIIAK